MRDRHIHTVFSCDSEAKTEDYIFGSKKEGNRNVIGKTAGDMSPSVRMRMLWRISAPMIGARNG